MVETERVWEELNAGLRTFVRRRIRNAADADDVVQRVFLQVHRRLETLRDESRLHAWIYGAARNAIVDYYRANGRVKESTAGSALDLPELGDDAARDDEKTALQELAGCLAPLIAQLSATDQEALRLIEFDGLSQVEAAEQLGLTVPGMKSRIQRARHRLRAVVEACCRVDQDRRGGIRNYEKLPVSTCGCGAKTTGDASDTERRSGDC